MWHMQQSLLNKPVNKKRSDKDIHIYLHFVVHTYQAHSSAELGFFSAKLSLNTDFTKCNYGADCRCVPGRL